MVLKDLEKRARAYALKNAIAHNGKAQTGAVLAGLFHDGLKKSDVKKVFKDVNKVIAEINKLGLVAQQKEYAKLQKVVSERKVREGLADLPGAKKGKVVMRISPAPSGPMHIGNALVACMNFLYVKKYGGKFYVRIEDTNPENIYKPAYKLIKDESKWLFSGKAKIITQSDRMKIYYKYAEKLINKGAAYVCTCSAEKFREYVASKKPCPCRKNSIKENLARWKKMLDKKGFKAGQAVLRFKSDMADKNPAMRDFPLARINETSHPLQKKKYRVWPLMNLAVSADDIEQGMTHIIRGKDHRDNAERQKKVYKALGKKYPWHAFLGRIKFKDVELSKTKIRKGIESGKFKGWDDKRLPTISSLKKQKYKAEAFWKLAEHLGLNENDKVMAKKDYFELLDTFHKKA